MRMRMKTEPNESLQDAFDFFFTIATQNVLNSNGIEAFKTSLSKAIKPDPKIVFVLLIVRSGVVQFLRTRYAIWLFILSHSLITRRSQTKPHQIGKERKNINIYITDMTKKIEKRWKKTVLSFECRCAMCKYVCAWVIWELLSIWVPTSKQKC